MGYHRLTSALPGVADEAHVRDYTGGLTSVADLKTDAFKSARYAYASLDAAAIAPDVLRHRRQQLTG